jgi:hypothetical protein
MGLEKNLICFPEAPGTRDNQGYALNTSDGDLWYIASV